MISRPIFYIYSIDPKQQLIYKLQQIEFSRKSIELLLRAVSIIINEKSFAMF